MQLSGIKIEATIISRSISRCPLNLGLWINYFLTNI